MRKLRQLNQEATVPPLTTTIAQRTLQYLMSNLLQFQERSQERWHCRSNHLILKFVIFTVSVILYKYVDVSIQIKKRPRQHVTKLYPANTCTLVTTAFVSAFERNHVLISNLLRLKDVFLIQKLSVQITKKRKTKLEMRCTLCTTDVRLNTCTGGAFYASHLNEHRSYFDHEQRRLHYNLIRFLCHATRVTTRCR